MTHSQQIMHRSLAKTQSIFTSHIRDPEHQPAPGDVNNKRMEVYRQSLYLNIERMCANFFPVLKKTLPDDHWNNMIRDYFIKHRAHIPPFLPRIGQEFLLYLENERDRSDDPVYILELAHYEWIEFVISIDTKEIDFNGIDTEGDFLTGIPVSSQLAIPVSYQYPVHIIKTEQQPDKIATTQPIYLVVYRDRHYKVGFIELNPVSARLLELIVENRDSSGRLLLNRIASELRHPDPAVVISGGLDIMKNLQRKDVLLGVKAS